jgi:Flp pilus assembly protein TadG
MIAKRFRRFLRARAGSLPLMTALLLVPMTIMSGGAVDLITHEKLRTELQDALDRGVLAAAALSQTQTAQQTVTNYLHKAMPNRNVLVQVTEDRTINSRKVTATATLAYTPAFLKLAGLTTLTVPASAVAQEKRQKVEMSLVLDISGSMYDNGGMIQLKPAAKSFIDTILKAEVRPVTSVSIVPFAGQVNLGQGVFDYLASGQRADGKTDYVRRHPYSSCFEMLGTDFGGAIPAFPARDQVAHFTYYNFNAKGKQPWWCPTDDASVSYLSNDPVYLKARIDALQPFDGTGTAYGMKWAELLLDPAMRSAVTGIASRKLAPIPAEFVGRPAAFDDTETMKFIVLMTDGQIGFQPRPTTKYVETTKNISAAADHREIFSGQVSAQYKQICDYSKSKGITVFTIAFKISDNAVANSLAACASNASYAYRVDGLDIANAFQSIATAIQKIKLVG